MSDEPAQEPYPTHRCVHCQLMRCTKENEACEECQQNVSNPKPQAISFEELQRLDYWGGFQLAGIYP